MDSSETKGYLDRLEDMTVCVLGVEDGVQLETVSQLLSERGIRFHLWIEKPEMIPTALATAPVTKESVLDVLGGLKLLR